jgi:benzoylformate decarboxylase
MLPIAIEPLGERLCGFEFAVVIGAPVFRYYPYISGTVLPPGCELLQITSDPSDAASALVGDSLLGDAKLALEALLDHVEPGSSRVLLEPLDRPHTLPSPPESPLAASEVYAALSELCPEDVIVVQESPPNVSDLALWWPTVKPGSYYTYASGVLGWNAPVATGIALAQQHADTGWPVVAVIGDGAMQYSVQCLAAAGQHRLKVIYIVPCNGEYAILKEFAVLKNTSNVPGSVSRRSTSSRPPGFGCAAVAARTEHELRVAFAQALRADGPTLIAVPIQHQLRSLVSAIGTA